MQDIFNYDIFPIKYRLHPGLNFVGMGPYAANLDALDRIHSNNKNLVPVIPAVNPGADEGYQVGITHSAAQVYSEAWTKRV